VNFAPGTLFAGDYRIERPLSAGGMGAVFVVRQMSTGKLRALKLMHRSLANDPESLRRFEQEARVGSRIASEHVVEVQAAGVDPATGVPFLVMELLEGESLAARLARGRFEVAEALPVLEQLAHALGAAHAAGVTHRDLKPENIFLGVAHRTGRTLMVKVLDFGIAKLADDERRTTSAFGTPLWLAPEQTHRGEITPAADVWAFGLLVFVMLVGRSFWHSVEGPNASIALLMNEILHDPIPLASTRAFACGRPLPDGFDAWFARAVTRDPAMRYPNARAAFDALSPLLRGQLAGTVMAAPPARPKRSSAGLVVAVVLAIAVLAAGTVVAVFALRAHGFGGATAVRDTPAAPLPAPSAVAATETAQTAPTATGTATAPAASATAEPAAASPVQVNAMVLPTGATVNDEVTKELNLSVTPKLGACFAADAGRPARGNLLVAVHFAKGRATSAQPLTPTSGPAAQCMIDTLKKMTLASPTAKGDAMITLTWEPD
jgi:tRNA A-37 threonylcarbamoyl transferase component Bud32